MANSAPSPQLNLLGCSCARCLAQGVSARPQAGPPAVCATLLQEHDSLPPREYGLCWLSAAQLNSWNLTGSGLAPARAAGACCA